MTETANTGTSPTVTNPTPEPIIPSEPTPKDRMTPEQWADEVIKSGYDGTLTRDQLVEWGKTSRDSPSKSSVPTAAAVLAPDGQELGLIADALLASGSLYRRLEGGTA
jgi:hypothetical protein